MMNVPVRFASRLTCLLFVLALCCNMAFPTLRAAASPAHFLDPITIGGLIIVAKVVSGEVQNTIQTASSEAQTVLQQANDHINGVIAKLDETYKDNLNVTINSLDNVTKSALLAFQRELATINQMIQENIGRIEGAVLETIRQASNQIQIIAADLEQRLSNLIIIGGETVAYVLDRTFYNAILVIALIFIGIGLLAFSFLWFRSRLPQGFALILVLLFMVIYLGGFGTLIVVPTARAAVMEYSGVGLEARVQKVGDPEIITVEPPRLILQGNPELHVIGFRLLPQGEIPAVRVGDTVLSPVAQGDDEIVVSLGGFSPPPSNSVTVQLEYQNNPSRPSAVVQMMTPTPVLGPPDLAITGVTFNKTTLEIGENVVATVTVQNVGETASSLSQVRFRNTSATTVGQPQGVPALSPGQTSVHQFVYSYSTSGSYSVLAEVDASTGETNGGNNSTGATLSVLRRIVTVEFTTQSPTHHGVIFGARGRDRFNTGSNAGACNIDQIFLDLLAANGNVLRSVPPNTTANYGGFGGTIVESNVGTNNYSVVVNWWFDTGSANRQRVRYVVTGREGDCNAPPNTVSSE